MWVTKTLKGGGGKTRKKKMSGSQKKGDMCLTIWAAKEKLVGNKHWSQVE